MSRPSRTQYIPTCDDIEASFIAAAIQNQQNGMRQNSNAQTHLFQRTDAAVGRPELSNRSNGNKIMHPPPSHPPFPTCDDIEAKIIASAQRADAIALKHQNGLSKNVGGPNIQQPKAAGEELLERNAVSTGAIRKQQNGLAKNSTVSKKESVALPLTGRTGRITQQSPAERAAAITAAMQCMQKMLKSSAVGGTDNLRVNKPQAGDGHAASNRQIETQMSSSAFIRKQEQRNYYSSRVSYPQRQMTPRPPVTQKQSNGVWQNLDYTKGGIVCPSPPSYDHFLQQGTVDDTSVSKRHQATPPDIRGAAYQQQGAAASATTTQHKGLPKNSDYSLSLTDRNHHIQQQAVDRANVVNGQRGAAGEASGIWGTKQGVTTQQQCESNLPSPDPSVQQEDIAREAAITAAIQSMQMVLRQSYRPTNVSNMTASALPNGKNFICQTEVVNSSDASHTKQGAAATATTLKKTTNNELVSASSMSKETNYIYQSGGDQVSSQSGTSNPQQAGATQSTSATTTYPKQRSLMWTKSNSSNAEVIVPLMPPTGPNNYWQSGAVNGGCITYYQQGAGGYYGGNLERQRKPFGRNAWMPWPSAGTNYMRQPGAANRMGVYFHQPRINRGAGVAYRQQGVASTPRVGWTNGANSGLARSPASSSGPNGAFYQRGDGASYPQQSAANRRMYKHFICSGCGLILPSSSAGKKRHICEPIGGNDLLSITCEPKAQDERANVRNNPPSTDSSQDWGFNRLKIFDIAENKESMASAWKEGETSANRK